MGCGGSTLHRKAQSGVQSEEARPHALSDFTSKQEKPNQDEPAPPYSTTVASSQSPLLDGAPQRQLQLAANPSVPTTNEDTPRKNGPTFFRCVAPSGSTQVNGLSFSGSAADVSVLARWMTSGDYATYIGCELVGNEGSKDAGRGMQVNGKHVCLTDSSCGEESLRPESKVCET